MKKILLGIIGNQPRESTVRYALGLARRIRANVDILQVLQPSVQKRWQSLRRGMRAGADLFEKTMISASYAEAGDYQTVERLEALLAKSAEELVKTGQLDAPPSCAVFVRAGDPEAEIRRFVESDPDVVLAVWDAADTENPAFPVERLSRSLEIPAVMIRPKNQQKGTLPSMKVPGIKRKAVIRALIFGALSVGLYIGAFLNQATLLAAFTKGGLYALLPVGAVFIFSYVHGTFASNVWTALGIVASRKTPTKQAEKTRRVRQERPRPRPVLRA